MEEVFINDDFKIYKKNDELFNFTYSVKNDFIISSLNIQDKIRSKIEKDGDFVIEMKASSIEELPTFLSKNKNMLNYDICVRLLLDIGSQCIRLEENNLVYANIDIRNIISIDNGDVFIYLDNNIFNKINKKTFNMNKYVEKTIFSSPELLSVNKLPSIVSSVSWVYSLGAIVFHCLTSNRNIQRLRENEIKREIQAIQDTKLYFCLLRMLENREFFRVFLFI
jgi:hypothetical protein